MNLTPTLSNSTTPNLESRHPGPKVFPLSNPPTLLL